MSKPRGRPSSRARILQAASELALEIGPGNLSLDAVAERAGVSKGGLLYNFKTKRELLRAIVADHLSRLNGDLVAAEARHAGSRNRTIRALIEQSCVEGMQKDPDKRSGFLAAIADDPQFLDPVREHVQELVERMRCNSADPMRALVAFLALEGLKAQELFEMSALTAQEKADTLRYLAAFVEDGDDLRAEPSVEPADA